MLKLGFHNMRNTDFISPAKNGFLQIGEAFLVFPALKTPGQADEIAGIQRFRHMGVIAPEDAGNDGFIPGLGRNAQGDVRDLASQRRGADGRFILQYAGQLYPVGVFIGTVQDKVIDQHGENVMLIFTVAAEASDGDLLAGFQRLVRHFQRLLIEGDGDDIGSAAETGDVQKAFNIGIGGVGITGDGTGLDLTAQENEVIHHDQYAPL